MELCRFVSIMLIVMLHTGFQNFGVPTSLTETTPSLLLMQSFCNVGVDVFVLLTGFYSSKLKTKSFLNLAYICLFYAAVALLLGYLSNQPVQYNKVFFISKSNWFIPSYLCLLTLTPFINKACEVMSKKELLGGVIVVGLFLTWFGWLPALADVSIGSNNGCSTICFAYLYIIGRYIRLYGLPTWFTRYSILYYISASICIASLAYLTLYYGRTYQDNMNAIIQRIYANNNPLMILSSVALFSSFQKMNIKNSRIINFCAKSTLAVLLLHGSRQFAFYMMPHFQSIYQNYDGILCAVLWLASVLAIGIMAVAVDQVRIISFNIIAPHLQKKTDWLINSLSNKFYQ